MQAKISIVQLSDTHLFSDQNKTLFDVNTARSLTDIIAHVGQKVERIDCVLVTGDLVHDETEAGYRILKDLVANLQAPVYFLPGNHDDVLNMNRVLSNTTVDGINSVELGNWKIILLDSSVHGNVEGFLNNDILNRLENELKSAGSKHVLVAVHHHVVNIASRWLDELNLTNNREFIKLLEKYSGVRAVINGHIHQELDITQNNIRYLGVPSTCFQFRQGTAKAEIDNSVAGFRHIELSSDGKLETSVHYFKNRNV